MTGCRKQRVAADAELSFESRREVQCSHMPKINV